MPNSFTPSQVRRQVATVEGFTALRDPSPDATKAIADLRATIALKRTLRFVDRRVAKTDRRLISDRRAMQDVLNETARKRDGEGGLRFRDDAVHSAFQAFGALR